MIEYRKAEIEEMVYAVCRHWDGQPRNWSLIVKSNPHLTSSAVELHVEIALGSYTRTTTIPLGKVHDDGRPCAAAARNLSQGDVAAVAAVRRVSVQALFAQSRGDDVEPLLGYLRCCGILVLD